ncbi:MAG: hypothetical protein VB084_13565 [Syntrophomonadaceae bacterium]|nr:hypothetical protein [Syntrophomonadaceae bacterium]
MNNKTKDDSTYEVYLNERNRNIESKAKHAEMNDKAILTLAAGAFGLSLTFVDKIAIYSTIHNLYWLGFAWIMFALSMLSTLISFQYGTKGFERQIEILDEIYKDDLKEIPPNKYVNKVQWCNGISIWSFILGVVFLIIFSLLNIKGGLSNGR